MKSITIPIHIARSDCVLCLDIEVEYSPLGGLDGWQVVQCEYQSDQCEPRLLRPAHDAAWLEYLDQALHRGVWAEEIADCIAAEIEHCLQVGRRTRSRWDAYEIEYPHAALRRRLANAL